MSGVNKVILLGNLGKDPEVRLTPQGIPVANFSVATSEKYTTKEGTKEKTEWHHVAVFGKTAELCETYLHKGSKVYLEGRLQTRTYEDKTGHEVHKTEIVADFVQFLSRD